MKLNQYNQNAQEALLKAQNLATQHENDFVEAEHLAYTLLQSKEIKELINKKGVDFNTLLKELVLLIKKLPKLPSQEPIFSARLLQLLASSYAYALSKGREQAGLEDIFISLIANKDKFGSLGSLFAKNFLSTVQESWDKNTPNLAQYCENINQKYKEGLIEKVFAREDEIQRLIQVLSRKNRHNPLLIGEAGVGKRSIIYSLVSKIIDKKVPSYLMTKEIISLDISLILAGSTLRGQFEERMHKIFKELRDEANHYILFINDLSLLIGTGSDGGFDAANLLKNEIEKSNLQVLASVSPASYKKRIEDDPSLQRLFQPIWIEPPKENDIKIMLTGIQERLEQFHGVFITEEAINASIQLSLRHLNFKVMPQVAIDVLDEACAKRRIIMDRALSDSCNNKSSQKEMNLIESIRALKQELYNNSNNKISKKLLSLNKQFLEIKNRAIEPFVTRSDIAEVISLQTSVPAEKMVQSEKERLIHMQKIISQKIIGQEDAVKSVTLAIQRARVGLKEDKKPIGSFLFLGPSGVGKTELAKVLTSFLFDDEKALIRFDMSEFMEKHSVARLIGAPKGYQGSDDGGELTEKVRRYPYSVILFDEIEKAHVEVLNILLQILDDGRLSDAKGLLVDFKNTIIIMTSNIGAMTILEQTSINIEKELIKVAVFNELKSYLKPELINRIDEVVYFNPLNKETIKIIAELSIKNLIQQMQQEGYTIEISNSVIELLANEGFEPSFGARPLNRAITKKLKNPLAEFLLNINLQNFGKIVIDLNTNKEVYFTVDKYM